MRNARVMASVGCLGTLVGCAPPPDVLDEVMSEGPAVERGLARRGLRVLYIDNTHDLQTHIGDERTILVLATTSTDPGGNYVIPACATRQEETVDPYCGQMTLGYGSTLLGALKPEMDGPWPTGEVERAGPYIDCSSGTNPASAWDADDSNGWRLACLAMTSGVVWGVEIDNGAVNPQNPGQGSHRNGVLVYSSDGPAVVGRTMLTDVRRGVLLGADTDVEVWQVVVRRTELAGVFAVMGDLESDSPPKAVNGATIDVGVTSTRLQDIGLWSNILYWGTGGDSNDSHAEYRNVEVTSGSRNSFLFAVNNTLDPNPFTNGTAHLEVEDSRFQAYAVGLAMQFIAGSTANTNNLGIVEMDGATFANAAGVPVAATYAPWPGSRLILGMTDSAYVGAAAGAIRSTCNPAPIPGGCSDAEEPRFGVAGTAEGFLDSNDNFDLSALTSAHFTGEPLP